MLGMEVMTALDKEFRQLARFVLGSLNLDNKPCGCYISALRMHNLILS